MTSFERTVVFSAVFMVSVVALVGWHAAKVEREMEGRGR